MDGNGKLLIVEDDVDVGRQLKWFLADEYDVHLAHDAPSALGIMKNKRPTVVALDLCLAPMPEEPEIGMELLGNILQMSPNAKVVVVSEVDEKRNAMSAIKQGAWDYYLKPIKFDELRIILRRAFHVTALERENLVLQKAIEEQRGLDALLGSSSEMSDIFATIRKVASSELPILILGESGTGKELIARSIHDQSHRKGRPFVSVNCEAIPAALQETEVFGHAKGADHDGAIQKRGKAELAHGGTLFLDEITELPLPLQAKILRFLWERKIKRTGGLESREIDVRIIASSRKNFIRVIKSGAFREDLYDSLSIVSIEVPPLRYRGDDVLLLANYFMKKNCTDLKHPWLTFDPDALEALQLYKWPGNVRELKNRIRRAVVMNDCQVIRAEDLDLPLHGQRDGNGKTLRHFRESVERDFVYEALARNRWNVAFTAKEIGITRPTLYELMRKYNLKRKISA